MVKKICAVILSISMVVTVGNALVFANPLDKEMSKTSKEEKKSKNGSQDSVVKIKKQIRKDVLKKYEDDPQFLEELDQSPETANGMIDRVVDKKYNEYYDVSARGGYGSFVYCWVPTIKQATTYYCGYATMLQTLYGIGVANNVAGNNDDEKQVTLAIMHGDQYSSAIVWKVKRDLNTFINNYEYIYQQGSQMTQSNFNSNCYGSLISDRPVLLHAKTLSLAYYGGRNLGHYLSLDQLSMTSNTARIVDCNYDDNYRGPHTVPIAQAYGTVTPAGRYLIYY